MHALMTVPLVLFLVFVLPGLVVRFVVIILHFFFLLLLVAAASVFPPILPLPSCTFLGLPRGAEVAVVVVVVVLSSAAEAVVVVSPLVFLRLPPPSPRPRF